MLKLVIAMSLSHSLWAKGGEEPKRIPAIPFELLKCKPAEKKPENAARVAAEGQNFSDHESFSRLVLSESLSTGFFAGRCEAPSVEALMESIAWGIINRVKKYSPSKDDPKPDAYSYVIYQPKQFSPSFSPAEANPFSRIFLCPYKSAEYLQKSGSKEESLALYSKAKEVSARVMDSYQRSGIPVANAKLTQFFYPHSEFAAERPAWAKDADPTKNKGYVNVLGGEKPCVEFYQR